MAVEKKITVRCDICGRDWTFAEGEHSPDVLKHSVWVRLRTPTRENHILSLEEIDVCNDCMERQTKLEGDADGTIELKNVRNVHFCSSESVEVAERVRLFIRGKMEFDGDSEELRVILRQHRKFMDAIDDMPEDGGEL